MPNPLRRLLAATLPLCCATALAGTTLVTAVPAHATSVLQTFVLAVGGQSAANSLGFGSCATFGSPSPDAGLYGGAGVGSSLISVPTEGIGACGIAGGFNTTSAATGPLSDAMPLSTTFNGTANTFTGGASANADYGKIGAEAHGTFTGSRDGFTVDGAEGSSLFTESLTIAPDAAHLAGTAGTIQFTFSVDGSISVTGGSAYSHIEVVYKQGAGPNYILMRAQTTSSTETPGTSTSIGSFAGFSLSPGSMIGSGDFETFELPIVYGTAFDFTLGILAGVSPGSNGSVATVDFAATALLTGIGVFVGGNPVTDFTILSGSSTSYDANGVHLSASAAEPATLSIFGLGLAGLGFMRRRRAA